MVKSNRRNKKRKGAEKLFLPDEVKFIISELEKAGFEAFAVGGCVRDSLLGKNPGDYDIATSALPEETKAVFKDERIIETGIRHGTVTVLRNGKPFEITTFRIDAEYEDNRHPSKVSFTPSLKEDLARRDFTINALAYNEKNGIIDLFGGIPDLEHGIIRSVGDPEKRFSEDALRIMRALRFASVLGFEIEEKTAKAASELRFLLGKISAERLSAELSKLLCGKNAGEIIVEHHDIISVLVPEISALDGFEQHNFHHDKDALRHAAAVVDAVLPEASLRLAALFHDIAKPCCFSLDENGTGHFYGHAGLGAEMARKALFALKFDNKTAEEVALLIKHHSDRFTPESKSIKRMLGKIGPEAFEKLLLLMQADETGKAEEHRLPQSAFDEYRRIAKEILEKDECFSLKNLAINGDDLIRAGFVPGKEIGRVLEILLEKVIGEELPNEKEKLILYALSIK